MYQFIETIRLEDGRIDHLAYHQTRVNESFQNFFRGKEPIELENILHSCPLPSVGLHKIRIVYAEDVISVSVSLYEVKMIKRLRLVNGKNISYAHKFLDRNGIEKLFALRETCDDVIIVKDNQVTDTSYANLVFKKDGFWFTSNSYLLNGTTRQRLLKEEKIFEAKITINDLARYEKVKLINAMLLFNGPEIDVSQIVG